MTTDLAISHPLVMGPRFRGDDGAGFATLNLHL